MRGNAPGAVNEVTLARARITIKSMWKFNERSRRKFVAAIAWAWDSPILH